MVALRQKSVWRERVMRYAPLILWIGVIALLSSGQAAMSKTSFLVRPFLEFFFPTAPEETLQIYHGYIRKLAHFTEYAILAFWAARAFWNSSKPLLQQNWFICSLGLVALVAIIDETNQSFNSARTGSPYDVLIDCCGGLIMLIFLVAIRYLSKRRNNLAI